MLSDAQKLVLKQIAERRQREGGRCYRETRSIFYQLMRAAQSIDPSLTDEEFMREAKEELEKHLQK